MTVFEEKLARQDPNSTLGPTDDFGPLFAANFIAPADSEETVRESRDDLPAVLRENLPPLGWPKLLATFNVEAKCQVPVRACRRAIHGQIDAGGER